MCEDCKSNFKQWISYKNRTQHDPKEIVQICDLIKDLHELNPTHNEFKALRKISREIRGGESITEIIHRYDRELEKIEDS